VRTYYELFNLPATADAEAIKTAFRREIVRYHPDKVIHLGSEFQEMAATRAAELTVAYKTLNNAELRADYDQTLEDGGPETPVPVPPGASHPVPPPPVVPVDDPPADDPTPQGLRPSRFASERAGRDVILRRALSHRLQSVVESLYGAVQMLTVRGFDFAFVPTARPRLLSAPLPRVLVKESETIDAAAVRDAWTQASRARVHVGKSPVIVLLCSRRMAPAPALLGTLQALSRQPKTPGSPAEIAVVAIDVSDWRCLLPPDASPAVRKLVDRIQA